MSTQCVYIDSMCLGVSSHDEIVYVNLCKQQLRCLPYMVHSPISLHVFFPQQPVSFPKFIVA